MLLLKGMETNKEKSIKKHHFDMSPLYWTNW